MNLLELYNLAEESGIDVDYFPMREIVSVSFPEGWIAMDVDKLSSSLEEKIHLAHELGHIQTGSFYNIYSPLDCRAKHENRANKWAIKKLIPKDELDDAVRSGFLEVWELAEYFDVTYSFMEQAMRYYQQQDLAGVAI
ncbi:MAG: ImmA/IrrE family metallo-endopeptidase [Candidatus Dehalobacter alkaniphilus]